MMISVSRGISMIVLTTDTLPLIEKTPDDGCFDEFVFAV
jgi:hypothetical protein